MDQIQLALLAMLGALAARFWEQTSFFADPKTSPASKIGTVYVTCLLLAALSGALNETFTLTAAGFRTVFFSAALMATCSQAFHMFLNSAVPGLGDILNGMFGNNKITQTDRTSWTDSGGTTNSSSVVSEKTSVTDQKLPVKAKWEPDPSMSDMIKAEALKGLAESNGKADYNTASISTDTTPPLTETPPRS